jgi:NADPH:quinone reductase-like Zn-dependent oxidoreductase
VLTPHGTLIQSYGDGGRWLGPMASIIAAAAMNRFVGQTLKAVTAHVTRPALEEVSGLIESGRITPVLDRTFPLADAAEAVRLVEEGSPAGKVVVTVAAAC